jgi:hypothetical protein
MVEKGSGSMEYDKLREREELIAFRAREIAWSATPLGSAFLAFKRALGDAIREDTRAENDGLGLRRHPHKIEALWAKAREAETTLRGLMNERANRNNGKL